MGTEFTPSGEGYSEACYYRATSAERKRANCARVWGVGFGVWGEGSTELAPLCKRHEEAPHSDASGVLLDRSCIAFTVWGLRFGV